MLPRIFPRHIERGSSGRGHSAYVRALRRREFRLLVPDRMQRIELDFTALGSADAEAGHRERAFFERIEAERLFDVDLVDSGGDEGGESELGRGEIHRLREMTDVED